MSLHERHSAWLDGELVDAERVAVETELAADPVLRAEVDSLRSVQSLLRSSATIELRSDAGASLIRRVDMLDTAERMVPSPELRSAIRRRVPAFASIAASFTIVVSVVVGIGGGTTLPAVGDLIARHDAAAAEMPIESSGTSLTSMPAMPDTMEMMAGEVEDGMTHAVYAGDDGSIVSVFRLDGELDTGALIDEMGGSIVAVDGHDMWAKDIGTHHVAVVDGDGYVWTIVSDIDTDPMSDLMNASSAGLPKRSATLAERLRGVADAIVEPFRLGI